MCACQKFSVSTKGIRRPNRKRAEKKLKGKLTKTGPKIIDFPKRFFLLFYLRSFQYKSNYSPTQLQRQKVSFFFHSSSSSLILKRKKTLRRVRGGRFISSVEMKNFTNPFKSVVKRKGKEGEKEKMREYQILNCKWKDEFYCAV
jgi:hypothetical protein